VLTLNEENVKYKSVLPWLKDLGFDEHNFDFEGSFTIKAGHSTFNIIDGKSPKKSKPKQDEVFHPRYDILVKDLDTKRNLFILEIKAEGIKLTDNDRDQAISYARLLDQIAPYCIVTNGTEHRIYDTISKELLNDKTKIDRNKEVVLNIDDYYDALKHFHGYSKDNLIKFCTDEFQTNAKNLISTRIGDNKKYIPEVFIENTEIDQEFAKFLSSDKEDADKAFLLVGESGKGKTCWICNTAEKMIKAGKPVFFYRFDDIDNGIFEHIAKSLNYNKDISPILDPFIISQKLSKIFSDQPVLIFLDGLDERKEQETSRRFIENFIANSRHGNYRIIATCKSSHVNVFLHSKDISTKLNDFVYKVNESLVSIKSLDNVLLDKYLVKYRSYYNFSGDISPKIYNQFKLNPFFIRLCFDLIHQKNLKNLDLSYEDIYSNYLDEIEKRCDSSKSLKVGNKLQKLAIDMLNKNEDYVEDNYDLPEDLFKYNILNRVKPSSKSKIKYYIGFYFSKFRDFLLCEYIEENFSKEDQNAKLESNELVGVEKEAFELLYLLLPDEEKKSIAYNKCYNLAKTLLDEYRDIIQHNFSQISNVFLGMKNSNPGLVCLYSISECKIIAFGFIEEFYKQNQIVLIDSMSVISENILFEEFNVEMIHFFNYYENKLIEIITKRIKYKMKDIVRSFCSDYPDRNKINDLYKRLEEQLKLAESNKADLIMFKQILVDFYSYLQSSYLEFVKSRFGNIYQNFVSTILTNTKTTIIANPHSLLRHYYVIQYLTPDNNNDVEMFYCENDEEQSSYEQNIKYSNRVVNSCYYGGLKGFLKITNDKAVIGNKRKEDNRAMFDFIYNTLDHDFAKYIKAEEEYEFKNIFYNAHDLNALEATILDIIIMQSIEEESIYPNFIAITNKCLDMGIDNDKLQIVIHKLEKIKYLESKVNMVINPYILHDYLKTNTEYAINKNEIIKRINEYPEKHIDSIDLQADKAINALHAISILYELDRTDKFKIYARSSNMKSILGSKIY